MKKIGFILVFALVFLLTGYNGKMDLNENYIKIIDVFSSPSCGTVDELYEFHICINNDNTAEFYGVFENEKIDGIMVEITNDEKLEIVEMINERQYWLIPENIDSYVCDGTRYGITFFKENNEEFKTCQGYEPYNKDFLAIHKNVKDYFSDEDIEKAKEIIHQQILEKLNL